MLPISSQLPAPKSGKVLSKNQNSTLNLAQNPKTALSTLKTRFLTQSIQNAHMKIYWNQEILYTGAAQFPQTLPPRVKTSNKTKIQSLNPKPQPPELLSQPSLQDFRLRHNTPNACPF